MRRKLFISVLIILGVILSSTYLPAYAAPRVETRSAFVSYDFESEGCIYDLWIYARQAPSLKDSDVSIFIYSYNCPHDSIGHTWLSPSEIKFNPLLKKASLETSITTKDYPSEEDITINVDLDWAADMDDWYRGTKSVDAFVSGTFSIPELGIFLSFDRDPIGLLHQGMVP